MEVHAEKCFERYCKFEKKHVSTLMHRRPPNTSRRLWNNRRTLCSMCSDCPEMLLTRSGRPDLLWSVHTLTRSVTTWNKGCDKRLLRLINYINQAKKYTQFCHVGNQIEVSKFGFFQDASFAGDVRDTKSTSGGVLCVFGSHKISSNSVDVPEANRNFSQQCRV